MFSLKVFTQDLADHLNEPCLYIMPSHAEDAEETIGEKTPVRLGLLILILGGLGTGLIGSVWWASKTSTQLEAIQGAITTLQTNSQLRDSQIRDMQQDIKVIQISGSPAVQSLSAKVNDNQEQLRLIQVQGSPAVLQRLSALETQVTKLREEFEIHKATTK